MYDLAHKMVSFGHSSHLIKAQNLPNVKCTLFMHGVPHICSAMSMCLLEIFSSQKKWMTLGGHIFFVFGPN
jgi:hypothetical protein